MYIKAWRPALRRVLGRVLAALALAILAATTLKWVGFALVAAELVMICFQYAVDQSRRRSTELAVLAGAVMAYVARSEQGSDWLLAAAGGLLVIAIMSEAELRRVYRGQRKKIANLDLSGTPAPVWWQAGLAIARQRALLVHLILVAAFGVGALAGWPAWPYAIVNALLCLAYAAAMLGELRRRLTPAAQIDRVQAALATLRPAFVVYHSAPKGSEYQVTMWLPYLDQIGEPYAVVLREAHSLPTVAAATNAPVIVCPRITSLDDVVVPSLKAVFYVNNGMKNTHMVRFNHLTHIQLLHGDSDKATSYNPVTIMFDRIFVAGQAGIDRYAKNGVTIPAEKFRIVGRPQVADIEMASGHIRDRADKVVLYAPTWTGNYADTNYCSLSVAEPLVRELLGRGATIILRPHPYSARHAESARQLARLEEILAEDQARTGRRHRWGAAATTELSVAGCFNLSDAMVSDVSSVASDFLFSNKPFAITDMVDEGAEFVEHFPLARAAYVLRRDMSNVAEVVTQLLETDPAEDVRRSVRAYYLGPFPRETYTDAFVEEARRCLVPKAGTHPDVPASRDGSPTGDSHENDLVPL